MIHSMDRKMGFYPISIPTSMALESLTNTGDFQKDGKPAITTAECLMVNLRTLVRNAVRAFGKDYPKASIEVLVDAVQEDVAGIQQVIEYADLKTELKLYYCDYDDLSKRFPNAKLVSATTDLQVMYAETTKKVLDALKGTLVSGLTVEITDWKLKGLKDTFLLTHLPIDLLSAKEFPRIRLIESHTGRIKTQAEFQSKLKLPKDVSYIPFNGLTLQIFGDGATFKEYDKTVKKKVLEAALKSRWHNLTTETRMKDSLKLGDKLTYELVKNMVYS